MQTSGRTRLVLTPLLVVSLAAAAACGRSAQSPQAPASEAPAYAPTATIKDLMQSIVDPSADTVWLAVTTVQTLKGTEETAPKTDEEWAKVRHGAIALAEASNLLMMPGRTVARPGEKSDTPGVELEPSEMQTLIDKDRAAWNARARDLHGAAVAAIQAVHDRSPQKVVEVSEQIERACENCHSHYWYPNEKIPPVPSTP